MRTTKLTQNFKRDYRREQSGVLGKKLDALLLEVTRLLAADAPLAPRYADHELVGAWKDHRDCHIRPDLILIYRKSGDDLLELGFVDPSLPGTRRKHFASREHPM
jgi:mRNA interferase YafQ